MWRVACGVWRVACGVCVCEEAACGVRRGVRDAGGESRRRRRWRVGARLVAPPAGRAACWCRGTEEERARDARRHAVCGVGLRGVLRPPTERCLCRHGCVGCGRGVWARGLWRLGGSGVALDNSDLALREREPTHQMHPTKPRCHMPMRIPETPVSGSGLISRHDGSLMHY